MSRGGGLNTRFNSLGLRKAENFVRKTSFGLFSFLVAFAAASVLAPAEASDAVTCSSGVTPSGDVCDTDGTNFNVSVHYNPVEYFINVSSTAGTAGTPVSLDYTSASGHALGNVVTDNDTIKTTTNSPLTRQVMLSTTSSSNALENASNDATIPAGGGSTLVSASALSDDTWGFAIPSGTSGLPTNNFSPVSSYTASDTSTLNSATFTSVPALDNEIIVQEEIGDSLATAANQSGNTGQTIYTSTADVYYGVKATSAISSGTYSNTVRYTALSEAPDQLVAHPNSVDLTDPTASRSILIYTAIATTQDMLDAETATVEFYSGSSEDGSETIVGTCESPVLALTDTSFVTVTCDAPEIAKSGTYGIKITFANLGRVVEVDNLMTYNANKVMVTDGTIQGGGASGFYNAGETITIVADTCPTDYVFDYWSVEEGGVSLASTTSATTTFTMPDNPVTVKRNCKIDSFEVTVTGGEGSGRYTPGTTVTIKANACDTNYYFTSWTANGATLASTTSATTTFTMPSNAVTVTRNCTQKPYLTVSGGSGSGYYLPSQGSITITANACGTNEYFTGWTSNAGTIANKSATSTTFTMPASGNATVTRNCATKPYLTVSGGTGSGYYNPGQSGISISANACGTNEYFTGWTSNAGTIANKSATSTTFTMPASGNATVTRNCATKPYLTVSGGTGSGYYNPGQSGISISASACATGQVFNGWTKTAGTIANASASSTTFTMPASGNATVTRNCTAKTTCSQFTTNETGTISGQAIKKLADGKCWQSSNYRSGVTWANRGSCPSGFTFPTQSDFNTLISSVGSGSQLYSAGWSGYYWSSTEYLSNSAYPLAVNSSGASVIYANKTNSGNVRCYIK